MRTNPRNVAAALALVVGTCVAGTAVHAAGAHQASAPPSSPPPAAVAEPLQDCETAGTLPAEPTTTTTPDPTATTDPAATTTTTTLVPLPIPVPPPLDNDPEPQQYFGRLQIPAIDVDSPFLEGIRLSTLDYGPGHWPCTAMPGELGNVVVAGHRTSHNADFRRLDELKPGDEVIFDMDNSDGPHGDRGRPRRRQRRLRVPRELGRDRAPRRHLDRQPGVSPRGHAVRLPSARARCRSASSPTSTSSRSTVSRRRCRPTRRAPPRRWRPRPPTAA